MNMVRYEPWSLMNRFHKEFERMLDFPGPAGETASTVADWVPAVDIREEDERFVLRADLPGVEARDIDVTMEDGVLTVRGNRQTEERTERGGYRRVERVSGSFYRRFTLPDTADAEGISASSANGVLEVTIPKQARVQPRRIAVHSG